MSRSDRLAAMCAPLVSRLGPWPSGFLLSVIWLRRGSPVRAWLRRCLGPPVGDHPGADVSTCPLRPAAGGRAIAAAAGASVDAARARGTPRSRAASAAIRGPSPYSDARLLSMDVLHRADPVPVDLHATPPRVLVARDSVWRKHQVDVERTVPQRHQGPSADDVGGFGVADPESEFAQRLGERSAVLDCLLNEQVGVLRRVRVTPARSRRSYRGRGTRPRA